MKNNIRILLKRPCISKLQFVKSIKDLTGLGLKESKDIVDNICKMPFGAIEFEILDNFTLFDVKNKLSEVSFAFDDKDDTLQVVSYELSSGIKLQREKKMLQLGVGTNEEYIEFLSEIILNNFSNSKDLLTFVLNKLTKEELIDTLNKTKF